MRYLCIYKSGKTESCAASNEQEMSAMGKLIEDMARAGVLLLTEGCMPSERGARVRNDGGKISVVDGPFPEAEELIAGMCLMQVKSKAEALEWTKRFIAIAGEGESEVRELREFAPERATHAR